MHTGFLEPEKGDRWYSKGEDVSQRQLLMWQFCPVPGQWHCNTSPMMLLVEMPYTSDASNRLSLHEVIIILSYSVNDSENQSFWMPGTE